MIKKINYTKTLSSLLCSTSIIALSFLCLLNNLSFDIYSAGMLLRVVIPAAFCFWFIGYSMGHILDNYHLTDNTKKSMQEADENEAYKIPSMFSSDAVAEIDDGIGEI